MTEAGPRNGTFEQGSDAILFCRVKSLITPHVQWLKKLDPTLDQGAEDQVWIGFNDDDVVVVAVDVLVSVVVATPVD